MKLDQLLQVFNVEENHVLQEWAKGCGEILPVQKQSGVVPSALCRATVPMSQPEEPGEPTVGVQKPSASNLEWLGILSC